MSKELYFQNLADLIDTPLFIDREASSADNEARHNLGAIAIDAETALACRPADFLTFLDQIMANRKSQLGSGQHMIFYVWLDEMAGQLRFSLVSDTHKQLPFRSKINSATLSEIIVEFLACVNMDGIPDEDFEDETSDNTTESAKEFVQKVYSTVI